MKINFDKVKVYLSLDKEQGVIQNLRKDFANLIYMQGAGIEAHALALKIYNGDTETEYTAHDIALIKKYAKMCAPCVIDAFETMLSQSDNV